VDEESLAAAGLLASDAGFSADPALDLRESVM
jgi:hypothetical protein